MQEPKEGPAPSPADLLAGGGEMGERMRSFDWEATPLGPSETWPRSLKTAARIMLSSRQPIWIGWGKDLTYLYNDPYKSIIGGKHPWALGKPTSEVWREIWPDIGPMLDTAMTGVEGTYVEAQLLIMERNGYPEETYYTFSYSPIPDDRGNPGGIICANTDDTRRVIGERQLTLLRDLAARTANARTWQEACAQSVSALGANRRDLPFAILYVADPASETAHLAGLCGVPPGHPAAPESLSIAAQAPWPFAPWPFAEVLRTQELRLVSDLPALFGADLPTGDWDQPPDKAVILPIPSSGDSGRAGFLIAGLNPFRLFDEDYRGFLGLVAGQIGAAIANAQAYEEERRRVQALAEIDRAKTAFFSNVSHEFRTPLTLMLGPLEEALSTLQGGERELIGTAHRNGLRLLQLVNSLLDFSRIEAGRVQANYEPADLAAFTAELAAIFRSAVEKAGLRLTVDCPPLPQPVYVDRDMWEKIVLNLLSNAFKFTFDGEIAVTLSCSADEDAAILAVRDTGTGIPAHELPRLFERFHRIEGAKGRTFEGSGIGLALVQELVRLHGGAITAESEVDRGTEFRITIPFGTAHLPPERIAGENAGVPTSLRAQAYVQEALRWLPGQHADEPAATGAPSRSAADDLGAPRPAPGVAGGRILVADDNADMRDYVARLLTGQNYAVTAVPDGEAALAAAKRQAPDLVLSDIMMPRLDGYGLLRALRADPVLGEVPIVLLSARAGEEARVEGLGAGADDYLTKPFSARELLARVSANLQMARMRREAAEALRARTEELETVLETVPAAVWFTHDPDATHVRGNRQAAALLRLPETANASLSAPEHERPAYRVFHAGREVAPDMLPVQRAARGEDVRAEELDIRFADGSSLTILMNAAPLRDAAGRVAGAVGAAVEITARKRAESRLRALNQSLETQVAERTRERDRVWSVSQDLFVICGLDGDYRSVNPAWTVHLGYEPGELIGTRFDALVHPDDIAAARDAFGRLTKGMMIRDLDLRLRARDGSYRWYSWTCIPEDDVLYATGRDVTVRKELEEQLRQAQKMEAVGQLTGGVAHDMNNLLLVIQGNLEAIDRHLSNRSGANGHRLERAVQSALRGTQRAAALTHRLLAFGRRQPLAPKPLHANKLVSGMSDLLRRTLGETIAIETVLAGGLWHTFADPNQLENAVLNLAINARDAMPNGGKLTIETANAYLDEAYAAAQYSVLPGQYVMIALTDTGTGMSKDIMAQAFEPFFTTKEMGKGTGLGLSQVYGFVKQSEGHVKIYSEPGEGTTVRIYLPRHIPGDEDLEEDVTDTVVPPGMASETILVLEDDDDVRANSVESLRELGYSVLEANDGPTALRILDKVASVRLLFTDVGLPGGMNGRQVADEARRRHPRIRVLFTTGYARNAIVHHGRLDPGVELIVKPYTHAALAAKIRAVLEMADT